MIRHISTKTNSNVKLQVDAYERRMHKTFNYCLIIGVGLGVLLGFLFLEDAMIGFFLGASVSIILPGFIEAFRHLYNVKKK